MLGCKLKKRRHLTFISSRICYGIAIFTNYTLYKHHIYIKQTLQKFHNTYAKPLVPPPLSHLSPYHYPTTTCSYTTLVYLYFHPQNLPLPSLINGARMTKTSKLMVNYIVIICLSPITKDHALIKIKIYLHNPSKYTNFASRMNDSPFL